MKPSPIIIKEITPDISGWLEDKCPNEYSIQPHMIRHLWAGPLINLPSDQKYMAQIAGYEIWINDEKMAAEFKINFDI